MNPTVIYRNLALRVVDLSPDSSSSHRSPLGHITVEVKRTSGAMGEEVWTPPENLEDFLLVVGYLSMLLPEYKKARDGGGGFFSKPTTLLSFSPIKSQEKGIQAKEIRLVGADRLILANEQDQDCFIFENDIIYDYRSSLQDALGQWVWYRFGKGPADPKVLFRCLLEALCVELFSPNKYVMQDHFTRTVPVS